MATFKINGKNFATQDGTGEPTVSSNVVFPTGHVIQVKSTIKTDTTSRTNSNTTVDFADITGMSVSITPKTGNKVFVQAMLGIGTTANFNCHVRLVRGSTEICIGDTANNRARSTQQGFRASSTSTIESVCLSFLDTSPGGDGSTEITYKVQWDGENSSVNYLNRSVGDGDSYALTRTASTITVMEIAG